MRTFGYEIATVSDRGIVKKENEDAFFVGQTTDQNGETIVMALVADGMGGTAGGKRASMYVRDTFKRWFLLHFPSRHGKSNNFNEEELLREWDDLVQHCHHTLSQMQQMGGSTLTLLLLYCGTFYALNIGDSRIYRYTENRLYQITVDHSWAQLAFEHGMTAKEIESDSRRNSLTRCIGGGAKTAEADYFAGFYMDEDGFLLCSDGLRHLISVAELTVCLTEGYPQECLHQLVETAKKRGETDNLTGIAIKVNTVEG